MANIPQFNPVLYVSHPEPPVQPYNGAADAESLQKAMKGVGTDDKVLSMILGSRTRDQLLAVKDVFEKKFGKSLESWIKGDTSGGYQTLCLALIEDKYEYDAKLVNHAIKGLGTNDDELIEVICSRLNSEIIGMKNAYKRLFKVDVEKDVTGDTSGDYQKLLLQILKAQRNEGGAVDVEQCKKDAKALYDAGEKKVGTDEKVFIDILANRSFPQLYTINSCYGSIAGHSLESAIAKETSFNFKNALVALITPREEYFALQIRDAIEGTGTKDQKLIRNVCYLSSYPILFQAVNASYMHKYKHTIANDVGGDTSGWYGKTAALVINRVVNL